MTALAAAALADPQPAPPPAEAAPAPAAVPTAQALAGDAASPEAIRRLSRSLSSGGAKAARAQVRVVDKLKAAVGLIRMGDYRAGAERALQALAIDERSSVAWHVLAICREKSGDLSQALAAYDAALRLADDERYIAHDLGRLAHRLGHLEIAEKLFLKYLVQAPGDVEATNNLACVLRDQKRYGDAVDILRDLIGVEPAQPILWNTLGTVLTDQGQMAGSMPFFEEALRLDPGFAKARYNRGNARQALGEAEGALADIEASMAGAEGPYEAAMMRMARAMTLMGLGQLGEGFAGYEARLDPAMPDAMHVVVDAPRPAPGEPVEGRRVLVVGEQGIADEMLFGTCVPDLIAAVGPEGRVYLAVEARLVEMFARTFPTAVVGPHRAVRLEGRLTRYVPFVEDAAARDGPLDGWVPMASLMAEHRRAIADFPERDGYLTPDPARVDRWRAELARLGAGPKVGLHWKSLVLTGVRARYFSGFAGWAPILEAPGWTLVNLQCGDTADDLAWAQAAGHRIWTPPIDLKTDLEDLAALSVALDLVVGPGIAGVNMAASVGARTWMVHQPDDWRLLGTDRYPFYPRVRMFPTGGFDGWPGAIRRIRQAMDRAVAEDRAEDWNGA